MRLLPVGQVAGVNKIVIHDVKNTKFESNKFLALSGWYYTLLLAGSTVDPPGFTIATTVRAKLNQFSQATIALNLRRVVRLFLIRLLAVRQFAGINEIFIHKI